MTDQPVMLDFTGERLVPDQARSDDLYHEHIVRYHFAAQFVSGRAVLDAGCGAGYGSALLAEAGAATVLGVDISAQAIAYARQHYHHSALRFDVADLGTAAPGGDLVATTFDRIVSFEVIEHLDHPGDLVRTAARLLGPGGVFIVSTPNTATYPAGNPFHKHELTKAEFLALLAESFPAVAMFEQDYATALSLRPSPQKNSLAWTFLPAGERAPSEPDYFVAICAADQPALDLALHDAKSIMYELAADRLGERIQDLVTVQTVLARERAENAATLAAREARIAQLEGELKRQGEWAAGLEQQVRRLSGTWYVRLARRLGR